MITASLQRRPKILLRQLTRNAKGRRRGGGGRSRRQRRPMALPRRLSQNRRRSRCQEERRPMVLERQPRRNVKGGGGGGGDDDDDDNQLHYHDDCQERTVSWCPGSARATINDDDQCFYCNHWSETKEEEEDGGEEPVRGRPGGAPARFIARAQHPR